MLKPIVIKEIFLSQENMNIFFENQKTYRYSAWERVHGKNIQNYKQIRYIGNKPYGKIGSYKLTDETMEEEYQRSYDVIVRGYPHLENAMTIMAGGDVYEYVEETLEENIIEK